MTSGFSMPAMISPPRTQVLILMRLSRCTHVTATCLGGRRSCALLLRIHRARWGRLGQG
jgi:hypothetical protein